MKKYITKRNIINVLGLVSAGLGIAIQMELLESPNLVKYALFAIALIGYVTNDTIKLNKDGGVK